MGIKMDRTATDAWTALKDNYGMFSEIAAINIEKWLQATEFIDDMDFLKHIEDMCEKWRSAVEKEANINNSNF